MQLGISRKIKKIIVYGVLLLFFQGIVGIQNIIYICRGSTFIVDDIALTPAGAYGLRKLNSTYTGSLMRVRRSSDNAELDIGFTGPNLAQNRLFASDTLWDKGTGVSISGGVLTASGSSRIINQNMGLVTGRTYRVTIFANKTGRSTSSRIRINTSSSLNAEGTNNVFQTANPANGAQIVQLDIVANNPILSIAADTDVWSGTISFVSVQEVTSGTSATDLNEGALLSFVGTGSAFVRTWYDQSGNGRHVHQTTTGDQPRIVNAGIIETIKDGKPGIRFLAGSQRLTASSAPFSSANEFSVNLVHQETVRNNNVVWSLQNDPARVYTHLPWSDGRIYFDVGGCCNSPQRLNFGSPFGVGSTNLYTYTNSVSANSKVVYGNGNTIGSGPAAAGTVTELQIGGLPGLAINGYISEFTVFGQVISNAQRNIIEQSQAAYYNLGGTYLPESPTALIATSGDGQVGLSWIPPSYIGGASITDYMIEYKLSSGTGWTVFADGVSTSTGTTVTGLTNSLSYDFRVSATNSKGTGTPSAPASALPQAVAGLQLWLRSDAGVVTSAGKVSSWIDQSGKGNTTTQSNSANQPSLVANALNFNPSISFSQGSATRLEGTFASRFTGTDITAFTVALPRSSSQAWAGMFTMWNSAGTNVDYNSQEGGVIFHRYSSTTQLGSERQGYYNTPANMLDRVSIFSSRFGGGSMRIRANGASSYSGAVTSGNFNANRYAIGSRYTGAYSNFLEGYVAETMVFNSVLSSTDQNKIESYLALKYGITLDQTTATNYTLSDGTITWNSGSGGTYKNDIAGIARDNGFSLNQTKSQSINNTGDITVEALATLGDKKSIVWANDGTATGTWIYTEKPNNITNRINREWQFQELNGDTGNIKISYPQTSLPSGFTGSLYMIIDTDNNFGNGGTTTLTGTLMGGSWEFETNVSNGNYVTLGQIDTIKPTIDSFSLLSGSLIPTSSPSITISYSDIGGSLINTGSFVRYLSKWNGTNWNDVSTSLLTTTLASQTGATINTAKLPFGKYRLDGVITDNSGNVSNTGSTIFYVDEPEMTVSNAEIDMGNLFSGNISYSNSITITIKTVGAPFSLFINESQSLNYGIDSISLWNGSIGYGYENSPFNNNINSFDSNTPIVIQSGSINTQGEKNTYTYILRFGGRIGSDQVAGNYQGNINFGINLDY